MTDTERFEELLEVLNSEIEEMDDDLVKENLQSIYEELCSIYERMDLMRELLADRLTHDEKQYYKIKHGLDVGIGYGITL